MQSNFISIEGSEGAGKSTALHYIQDYLTRLGKEVVTTREPGGTEIAEEIRKLLLHSKNSEIIQPETELLLLFAGRAQHLACRILPALRAEKWVVSDRYIDATYAYQGGGRGISMQQIKVLDKLIVGNLYPSLTLLLDVPVDLGVARTEKRGTTKDRIEQERIDFFVRVRDVYLTRAKEDPKRIKVIDASKPLPEVQKQIATTLDQFLAQSKDKLA